MGLSACMVGPDFTTPAAPAADKYLESANPAVLTDRQQYQDWWRVYNDPVLDRLVHLAYQQNLTLAAAGTRVLEARAVLGVAIGDFYPQQQDIAAALSYNQFSRSDPVSNRNSSSTVSFWRASMAFQVGWELDFWGKFRRNVQSADAAYLASVASYDDALVTLVGDVATTYIGIRTLQQQIGFAQQNVVRQRKALAIARARFEGGTSTKLDVYQAENVLAATEATVPQLTAQMKQGENALRVLLGMAPQPLGALLAGPQTVPVPPPTVAVGIPADLVRRRPDIRAAELNAAAQSAQIGVAKADLFPAFSLTGSFGTVSSNLGRGSLGDLFSSKGIAFAFGPAFKWDILNYGQITNTVRVQDAKLQTLLLQYQNAVLKAQQEVENGLALFLESQQALALLKLSVTAAARALEIGLLQYQLGTRDYTTVLTAQQNLLTAQNNMTVAAGNVATGLANTYRALGGGWQLREGHPALVSEAAREEMRQRTDWGRLLPAEPTPPPPALPTPADIGPTVRAPEW